MLYVSRASRDQRRIEILCMYVCMYPGHQGTESSKRIEILCMYVYRYVCCNRPILFFFRSRVRKRWWKKGSDEPMQIWDIEKQLRSNSTDVSYHLFWDWKYDILLYCQIQRMSQIQRLIESIILGLEVKYYIIF